MAQASRLTRKLRRLRNERRLAYKMMNHALRERDLFRAMLYELNRINEEAKAKAEEAKASAEPEAAQ